MNNFQITTVCGRIFVTGKTPDVMSALMIYTSVHDAEVFSVIRHVDSYNEHIVELDTWELDA